MYSVQRVVIDVDLDWDTEFVPWLEDMERNKIGVEDGVFIATVDPALRVLQPDGEGPFIMECVLNKLNSVSTLALTEFQQKGIFEFSATTNDDVRQEFKETMCHLHCYKTDTCCTSILKQDENIENVFNHLYSDVFTKHADVVKQNTFRSRVLADESGLMVERLYNKHSKNIEGFQWEKRQSTAPKDCPQSECLPKVGDVDYKDRPQKKSKLRRESLEKSSDLLCYGYGFECPDDSLNITAKLNLSRIFNILWLLPHHYPGLHSPYLYFGARHSFFPLHVEDGLTLSLNYLYVGHPKVWVIIPPWATELLEFHLQKSCIRLYHTSCHNLLGHKAFLPTICWLKERKIPFKIVIQRPGDLMVLYASVPHFGLNLGANLAQAINIATKSWIPWGINAKKCVCMYKPIHIDMLPIVAAFRKDLISLVMRGGVVVTPEMLRGMQLVRDEVLKSSMVLAEKEPLQEKGQGDKRTITMKCPVEKCEKTFIHSPLVNAKKDIIKHVKSIHKPFVDKLLLIIDQMFSTLAEM